MGGEDRVVGEEVLEVINLEEEGLIEGGAEVMAEVLIVGKRRAATDISIYNDGRSLAATEGGNGMDGGCKRRGKLPC